MPLSYENGFRASIVDSAKPSTIVRINAGHQLQLFFDPCNNHKNNNKKTLSSIITDYSFEVSDGLLQFLKETEIVIFDSVD